MWLHNNNNIFLKKKQCCTDSWVYWAPNTFFSASQQQLTEVPVSASTDLSWIKRVRTGNFFNTSSIVRYNGFPHRGEVALVSATASQFQGILIRFSGPSSDICIKFVLRTAVWPQQYPRFSFPPRPERLEVLNQKTKQLNSHIGLSPCGHVLLFFFLLGFWFFLQNCKNMMLPKHWPGHLWSIYLLI